MNSPGCSSVSLTPPAAIASARAGPAAGAAATIPPSTARPPAPPARDVGVGGARDVVAADHDGDLDLDAQRLLARRRLGRLLDGGAGRRGTTRDRSEVLLDQLAHRRLLHVADDDQGRVVGLVIRVVEALAVGGRDLLEILDGSDRRPVVGMLDVGERAELLDRLADRIVVDAQALLFFDHAAFGVDRRRKQLELAHALRLELQREADVRRRHRVVIRGHVFARERVDVAADLLEQARVFLGRNVLGALEHHVLEHVRDAADADALFLGSDVIEDLHGGDRRLVIGQEQHVQAVGQRPVLHVQLGRPERRRRRGRRRRRLRLSREATRSPARSAAAALGPAEHGSAGL